MSVAGAVRRPNSSPSCLSQRCVWQYQEPARNLRRVDREQEFRARLADGGKRVGAALCVDGGRRFHAGRGRGRGHWWGHAYWSGGHGPRQWAWRTTTWGTSDGPHSSKNQNNE